MSNFTKAEHQRYARHLAIPEFSLEGQLLLKNAKVLCVGAGGLGSPLLLYLAAAGVGHIGIIDPDVVEDSNLQRQIIYTIEDIGKLKVEAAKDKLLKLNPYIKVSIYSERVTTQNAIEIISEYDIVADGTDNFPTRYLINDACVLAEKVNVYGAISRFEGQVAVFNFKKENGERSPNYRDLFPIPPDPDIVQNCEEAGVLGVLPGIIGSMQASEIIKIITGIGDPLHSQLFIFDALSFSSHILKIKKNNKMKITDLIDYEWFCGLISAKKIKEISVSEFEEMKKNGEEFQLIDVREKWENASENMNGELIPLGSVIQNESKISRTKKVIIHCKSGTRSKIAIRNLEKKIGFDNLYNLTGGINAWKKQR